MMKRRTLFLLLLLLLIVPTLSARAMEAVDITRDCVMHTNGGIYNGTSVRDGKYTTQYQSKERDNPYLELQAPAGSLIHGLYVCFAEVPDEYEIQTVRDGVRTTVFSGSKSFQHVYFPISGGCNTVRLTSKGKCRLQLNEVFAFSGGDVPDWVQQWQPTCEKADIMFLVTHPDDEVIFFGGAIPTYAA